MKDELLKEIKSLAEQLQTLQEQAERLGVFTGDRELLECAECGLEEDVAVDGFLIVCRKTFPGTDTGLRFTKDVKNKGKYLCPACGKPAQFLSGYSKRSSQMKSNPLLAFFNWKI